VYRDAKFSTVLFEDYLYHLYAAAHQARASAEELASLAPNFTPAALEQLASRLPKGKPVDRIVIGSMTATRLAMPHQAETPGGVPYYIKLAVRFESNMRIGSEDDRTAYYVNETWHLSRAANVESVPEERMRATLCDNCGAPFAGSQERKCSSCGELVGSGKHSWVVTSLVANKIETRPVSLTGYAPEVGTNNLTRFQNGLPKRLSKLLADDPAFSQDDLVGRVKLIFNEMYQAWNDDELARARPYVSDSLFNYLRYWLDAYRAEGLENWVENYQSNKVSIAKLVRDEHYDAITIRIWATGKDYTVDKSNRVVGGSKTRARRFSEYWTLIRSAKRRGKASSEKKCPQCGAEQKISMAGNCEFCEAHITSGEFDWVLSKIEQDESYLG
jgi:predicted lipid-binding transport protein (Tim44 family)